MSYLLDTNVLCEPLSRNAAPAVLAWLAQVPAEACHVSVLSLGEIRYGIERAPSGRQRERLRLWLEHDLRDWIGERLLPVDERVAWHWAQMRAAPPLRPRPQIDALLAATAVAHNLRLVTRNVRDFDYPGLEVVNPWG